MIDLFGLGQGQAPQKLPEPQKPGGGLWLSLLVLDSVFIIIFGGAVAAKIYQYWRRPLPAPPIVRHRPAPKAVETAAKAPEPPATPATPQPSAPAKPVAKPGPKAPRLAQQPPPKLSLVNEGPAPHAKPTLAQATSRTGVAGGAPAKARPIIFKLHAANADSVELVGAFIVHGGRKEMKKSANGVWSVKLYLNPGQYRYFFSVDKKKTLDPKNPDVDRGASLLTIP